MSRSPHVINHKELIRPGEGEPFGLRVHLLRGFAAACALALMASLVAQERADERALFFTPDDPRLEWGACPDFFPDGCAIAVLHGDPAERNADVFFRVPARSELPRHWHTSAERMVLVSGELHLTFDGQKTEIARPGTYIYAPPKLPHEGRCASGGPCILFIAFEEPIDAIPADDGDVPTGPGRQPVGGS